MDFRSRLPRLLRIVLLDYPPKIGGEADDGSVLARVDEAEVGKLTNGKKVVGAPQWTKQSHGGDSEAGVHVYGW